MERSAYLAGASSLLLFATTAVLPLSADADQARRLQGRFSGSVIATGVDNDGDGTTRSIAETGGRGTFGRSTAQSTSESLPWDGVSFCGPNNLLIEYRAASGVVRYRNGDLLALDIDPSMPSTFCLDFVEGTGEFEIHYVVEGGTGRFDGASGLLTSRGTTQPLSTDIDGSGIQSLLEGELTGTVNLVRGRRGGDSDEDDGDD